MPKRIPVESVIVNRDGKRFRPPIGKLFDFTAEELADIKLVNPGAVRTAETTEEVVAPTEAEKQAKREADEKAAKEAAEAAALKAAAGKKTNTPAEAAAAKRSAADL